jgi:hypothetical protein
MGLLFTSSPSFSIPSAMSLIASPEFHDFSGFWMPEGNGDGLLEGFLLPWPPLFGQRHEFRLPGREERRLRSTSSDINRPEELEFLQVLGSFSDCLPV